MNRVFLIILSCLSLSTFAVQSDGEQPIEIRANTVVIDERTGLSIYTGDAKVVRGSLNLSAQTIHVFSVDNAVTKMIAKGSKNKLAHYKQDQPNQPRFVEATAVNITYWTQKELMHLKGKARLTQGFDSFTGDTLNYDAKNDRVVAKQSSDGTQRVKFKIKL